MHAHESQLYAQFARHYDKVFQWFFVPRHRDAVRRLQLPPGARVLDVGCGTGLSLREYPAGARVVGLDLSSEMLAVAEKRARQQARARVDLVRGDALHLPFPEASFDALLCAFVISVVSDPPALARELARVTRPGGDVVILNHFRSDNPLWGRFEDLMSPLCLHLGWRSDLTVEEALGDAPLEVTALYSLARLDLWKTVRCRRRLQEGHKP